MAIPLPIEKKPRRADLKSPRVWVIRVWGKGSGAHYGVVMGCVWLCQLTDEPWPGRPGGVPRVLITDNPARWYSRGATAPVLQA